MTDFGKQGWSFDRMGGRVFNTVVGQDGNPLDEQSGVWFSYDPREDMDEEIDRAIMRERLMLAFAQLKPRWASVMYMRYFEGMTLEDIARREGISRERVRQIQMRELERLKKLMRQYGPRYQETDRYKKALARSRERTMQARLDFVRMLFSIPESEAFTGPDPDTFDDMRPIDLGGRLTT